MSDEVKKPETILVEISVPTVDDVVDGIKSLFPTVKVRVVGEEEKESLE